MPVPGGPNIKTPFHALRIPVKNWGIFKGKSTAYCRSPLAVSRSAISSNWTFGLLSKTSFYSISIKLASGPVPYGYLSPKKVFLPLASIFFFETGTFLIWWFLLFEVIEELTLFIFWLDCLLSNFGGDSHTSGSLNGFCKFGLFCLFLTALKPLLVDLKLVLVFLLISS